MVLQSISTLLPQPVQGAQGSLGAIYSFVVNHQKLNGAPVVHPEDPKLLAGRTCVLSRMRSLLFAPSSPFEGHRKLLPALHFTSISLLQSINTPPRTYRFATIQSYHRFPQLHAHHGDLTIWKPRGRVWTEKCSTIEDSEFEPVAKSIVPASPPWSRSYSSLRCESPLRATHIVADGPLQESRQRLTSFFRRTQWCLSLSDWL